MAERYDVPRHCEEIEKVCEEEHGGMEDQIIKRRGVQHQGARQTSKLCAWTTSPHLTLPLHTPSGTTSISETSSLHALTEQHCNYSYHFLHLTVRVRDIGQL